MTTSAFKRRQLDEHLQSYRRLADLERPGQGWVKPLREALGMTQAQLGERLGITRQAVQELERSEAERRITLERLERLAQAMDCQLVYALVPNAESIESLRLHQARRVADGLLGPTIHSMRLEAQDLPRDEQEHQYAQLVDDLLRDESSRLWR